MLKRKKYPVNDAIEKHQKAVNEFAESVNTLKNKTGYNGACKPIPIKIINLPVKKSEQKPEPFNSMDRLIDSINMVKKKVEG